MAKSKNIFKREKREKKVKAQSAFNRAKWIRGFTIAAIAIWAFYAFVLDKLPEPLPTFFQSWFPASSINESLVWVICALGLNIVVGYAGLLAGLMISTGRNPEDKDGNGIPDSEEE